MAVRTNWRGAIAFASAGLFACSGDPAGGTDQGVGGSGGLSGTTSGGASGTGTGSSPSGGSSAGGAETTGGTNSGAGGSGAVGGMSTGAAPGSGATGTGGTGSAPSSGGAAGSGGGSQDGCALLPPLPEPAAFDCGPDGVVFEDSGRPDNRVNYVIVGDGYTQDQLDGLYLDHISNVLEHEDGMFGELGEPYVRYRNFINICALKVASQDSCIDDLDTGLECDTAFDGYGDDASRLGIVSEELVYQAIGERLPSSIDVDWIGVTINAGADNWWNSGGAVMVWNGGFKYPNNAASVALHEGGHSFHGLADEYDGTSQSCSMAPELNVTTDGTGAKWAEWLGFDHNPGTGMHGVFEGARYCAAGVYRPTNNSEMNQLPDYFNLPSIQKMIHDLYVVVSPIDAHTENSEVLIDPPALEVRLVDALVTPLEWSVDGDVVDSSGQCLSLEELSPGDHEISVRAVDDTPWVRDRRDDLEQTVTWNVRLSSP